MIARFGLGNWNTCLFAGMNFNNWFTPNFMMPNFFSTPFPMPFLSSWNNFSFPNFTGFSFPLQNTWNNGLMCDFSSIFSQSMSNTNWLSSNNNTSFDTSFDKFPTYSSFIGDTFQQTTVSDKPKESILSKSDNTSQADIISKPDNTTKAFDTEKSSNASKQTKTDKPVSEDKQPKTTYSYKTYSSKTTATTAPKKKKKTEKPKSTGLFSTGLLGTSLTAGLSGRKKADKKTDKKIDHSYLSLSQSEAYVKARKDSNLEELKGGKNWSIASESFITDIPFAKKGTAKILERVTAALPGEHLVITSALGTGKNGSPHKVGGYVSHHNAANPKLDIRTRGNAKELAAKLKSTGYFSWILVEKDHLDVQIDPAKYENLA